MNDLLDTQKRNLEVREGRSGEVIVDNLTSKKVENVTEFMKWFKIGESARMFAET